MHICKHVSIIKEDKKWKNGAFILKLLSTILFVIVFTIIPNNSLAQSVSYEKINIIDKFATFWGYGILISFVLFLIIVPIIFTIFIIMDIKELDKK